MTIRRSTKRGRPPGVKLEGVELDGQGTGARSRFLTLIYGHIRSTSIADAPARTKCPTEPGLPLFTNHYAPDCGRPTRGNFAAGNSGLPTVPVAIWRAGSSLGHVRQYQYACRDGWPPITGTPRYTLTKFLVPQGTLASQNRQAREGSRELRKGNYGE
jgi:hypothetical protein